MKKSKIWKIIGGTVGILALATIIPSAIVSCGSSGNSSNANSSSSSNQATALQLEEANYDAFFNNYIKNTTNFQDLVTNDLQMSTSDATTNFDNLCKEYNSLTNINQTDNDIFSSETDLNSSSNADLNPNNIWTTVINFNLTDSATSQSLSGTIYEADQLTSESVSNITFNKDNVSFTITINLNQYYYNTITDSFTTNSYQETYKYTNATIAPILLVNYADVTSSKVKPVAGWYISSVQNLQFINENTDTDTTQNFAFSNLDLQSEINSNLLLLPTPWNGYQGNNTVNNYLQNQFGSGINASVSAGQDWSNLIDFFGGCETDLNYGVSYTYLPVNNPDTSLSLSSPITMNLSGSINPNSVDMKLISLDSKTYMERNN